MRRDTGLLIAMDLLLLSLEVQDRTWIWCLDFVVQNFCPPHVRFRKQEQNILSFPEIFFEASHESHIVPTAFFKLGNTTQDMGCCFPVLSTKKAFR